jgi:cell division protein FtsZ
MMGTGVATGEDRAREAAEAAVNSPLLEDIDLNGARGILVNVTAGLDMAIGEFEDVGMAIKEFASDDANVVVGTVIDPNMSDELRVTVVATGIGAIARMAEKPVQLVQRDIKSGEVDYGELDRPTVIRKRAVGGDRMPPTLDSDMEYLDIPAFLRKQAD